jgi:uncharacterized membrane protein
MFENIFSSSAQVWTGLIAGAVALPILIHLINLMRHKKVEWAAMEFLLRSHRKNRSWVWLKQLLLLLSRIALLLLALLMLAQIGCQNDRVARLLGGRSTHHYVILDDSFSMGQADSRGRAFDRAVGMVSTIAARAKNRQNQVFSLLTFSGGLTDNADPVLNSLTVDTQFDQTIESTKGQLQLGATAAEVGGALAQVAERVANRKNENAIVYIVSDFCEQNWNRPDGTKDTILEIEQLGAAVELIDCSATENANLAVTRLIPLGNVRSAQTPLMMEVTVKNFSNVPATKVQVDLQSAEYPKVERSSRPEDIQPDFKQLPTVFIESIAPGKTASQAFPVFFNQPGQHVVMANLQNDALSVDNERFCDVEIKESSKVLLVESGTQSTGQLFSIVLNPGGSTGISTQLADQSFIRDSSADELDGFDTVYLFDIGKFDQTEIANLEGYVERGGGVVFFLGPNTNAAAYTQSLYRSGQGVFPLPLNRAIEIPEKMETNVSDLQPTDHPVFAPANSVKNSLLDLVQINKIFVPPLEWQPASDSTIEILANVRGATNQPLVVSKQFGKGRAMAVTTTANSQWNNWMRNATFLPIMLLMQDYVAGGRYSAADRLVSEPLDYRLDAKKYRKEATLIWSDLESREALPIGLESIESESAIAATIATDRPGVFEIWAQSIDGTVDVLRPTVNVDSREGDLKPARHEDLTSRMAGTSVNLVNWDEFNPEPKIKPASLLNRLLFCLLVALLVGEQLLAFSNNYSTSKKW